MALGDAFLKCPYPDCDHVGDVITKVHCRTKHGMEREDLFKKYGAPTGVAFDPEKYRKNSYKRANYVEWKGK